MATAPPTSAIPPRAQPKRQLRPMSSDESYIVDQLVRFPKDGRTVGVDEVRRRNLCRKVAEAISNGTLQVEHVWTERERLNFLSYAEQQLQDANAIIGALAASGPITLTDEQLAAVPVNARLLLERHPERKCVTITLEMTPAGPMVETRPDAGAAGGPPQAEGPAALSGNDAAASAAAAAKPAASAQEA